MSSKMVCDDVTVCAAASPRQLVCRPQLSSGNLLVWLRNWRHPVTSGQISYTCKITKRNHCLLTTARLQRLFYLTNIIKQDWGGDGKIRRNKWQFIHTLSVKAQPPNKSFIEIANWVKMILLTCILKNIFLISNLLLLDISLLHSLF